MLRMVSRRRRVVLAFVSMLASAGIVLAGGVSASAELETPLLPRAVSAPVALSGSQFDPGNIISDALFYDGNAMTQPQIQAFLASMVGSCTNANCLSALRVTTVSRAADRTVCGAYTGAANELASMIIYKVQQACGISAKVLLVTLQKEQGLITNRGPSATQIRIAMGYGCPDTAPCDSQFYGFYNQVYKAAWQLKRYSTPDRWGSFQPGTRSIGYHPNAACGARTVTIRNNATAALYNYTPYTPNAAALANLGGTGNSCSSYGNRNFWVFYNNWFGSTQAGQAQTAVDAAYAALGGAASYLGAPTTVSTCPQIGSYCGQSYEGGWIFWSVAAGAFPVAEPYLAVYLASGGPTGPLSLPKSGIIDIPQNGSGTGQSFLSGSIYSSSVGVFATYGVVRDEYFRTIGAAGPLGWPTGPQVCSAGRCEQFFQNGSILSTSTVAYSVIGDMATLYASLGGKSGILGYPASNLVTIPQNGGGTGQSFTGGSVFSSEAGTFTVTGAVRATYFSQAGAAGPLGWPTGSQVCTAVVCSQTFQNGSVYWSKPTGGWYSIGDIDDAYRAAGGPTGALGWPRTAVITVAENGGGIAQSFANGSLYASPEGAYTIPVRIRAPYFRAGGSAGVLGWPTAAESCTPLVCSQTFQNGTVYWSKPTGGWYSAGAIDVAYQAAGGPAGSLGWPRSGLITVPENGGGVAQAFTGGSIYSSPAGAFPVTGAVRAAYFVTGGSAGLYGWPTGAATCAVNGLCTQTFTGGTITR